MTTLGVEWTDNIELHNRTDDELDIRAILQKNEEKAAAYFTKIREGEVADAVAFCATEGKPYIVLPAPMSILDSDALSEFKTWARDQHIEARIFGIITERFQKQDDCVALALIPNGWTAIAR